MNRRSAMPFFIPCHNIIIATLVMCRCIHSVYAQTSNYHSFNNLHTDSHLDPPSNLRSDYESNTKSIVSKFKPTFQIPFNKTNTTTDQRDTLVAIYNDFGLSSWIQEDLHECNWRGVNCTELIVPNITSNSTSNEWIVEKLLLDILGLSSTIPTKIGLLLNLKDLDLFANNLVGTIPSEFGDLANLEILWLARNKLTGTIPTQFGFLDKLQKLYIYTNNLSGSVPSEIGLVSQLETLFLTNNDIDGTLPSELGILSNLDDLSVANNLITGTIPSELGSLSNLRALRLDRNNISGTMPTELGMLTNAKLLKIWNNKLSGPLPSEIGNLSKLISILFDGNDFTGTIPTTFGLFPDLFALYMNDTNLSGKIPSEFGLLRNLDTMHLEGNAFTGTIPLELENSPLLVLNISKNELTGDISHMCHVPVLCYDENELRGDDIFCKAERAIVRGEVFGQAFEISGVVSNLLLFLLSLS